MAQSSYNSQILATVAAAQIQGDGTSPLTFGCSITRTAAGTYKVILPTGEGLDNNSSFTQVQPKSASTTAGFIAQVDDEDAYTKTIRTFSTAVSSGTVATDVAIEVIVDRSTINI